jgi:hypothetical protein
MNKAGPDDPMKDVTRRSSMPSRPVESRLAIAAGAGPSTGRPQRGSTVSPPQLAVAASASAGPPASPRVALVHFADREQPIPMEAIDKVDSAAIEDGYLAIHRALDKKGR